MKGVLLMKNTIGTVLVTVTYTGSHMESIEKALQPAKIIRAAPDDREAISKALKEADVAILNSDLNDQILEEGTKLRWIHCNHAGLNSSARPEVFERGIILTGSAGRSGPVLAEHTFFLLLSLVYDSRLLEENQRNHKWEKIYTYRRGIYSKTMGIIGLGHTGLEVAARAKAFGMNVLAYDRAFDSVPENVDVCYSRDNGDTVDELLQKSDVVVLAVRLTDDTHHLINERAFTIMKDSAYLINMARGPVVDEKALYVALRDGKIAGAGSDVFETEPLSPDSPLWDLSNMIITPHCTPEMPDMPGNCVKIIEDNVERYRQGLPMRNRLDVRDVYTK